MRIPKVLNSRWRAVSVAIVALSATAFGVAVAVGIPDNAGVIHACYKSSGDLRLVTSAAACKNNETPISWNQTGPQGVPGPQGPAGPAGASGPQGPAGPAGGPRARGSVYTPPGVPPEFFGPNTSGWVSVTRIGLGRYCLQASPAATVADTLVVTAGGPGAGGGISGIAIWEGFCGGPNAGFQVITSENGVLKDTIYFTAVLF